MNIENLISKYERLDKISKEYKLDNEVNEFIQKNSELLKKSKENLESNNFNITIIAPMKAGKSTFINALLGEELLPNESEACTFFPIEINLNYNDKNIYRVLNNGQRVKIGNNAHYYKLYNDIRKLRNGQLVIDNLEKYVLGYEMKNIIIPKNVNIKIVDLPGINEAKDDNNENIITMFDNILKNSNQIIYLFDIQYYKASENTDILNRIKLYRPDLVEDILFILTKIDIFDYDKGKTIEDTKEDIKRVLYQIGITKANIVECSSKQVLVANSIKKAYEHDKNCIIYNLLNNSNIKFAKNIAKKISKAERLVNENSEYITQNVKLKRYENNGKSILILPEIDEIIYEMELKSGFKNLFSVIQDIIDRSSFIKAKTNNTIYERINNEFQHVINVLKEESKSEINVLIDDDKLKKFKMLNDSVEVISKIEDYESEDVDESKIEEVLSELVRDEMASMRIRSYYDTEWYQYDDNVYDIRETIPGGYKENLEYEASCNYNKLVTAIYNNVDLIIKEGKKFILDEAQKYVDKINSILQSIYEENNINYNDKISLNIAANSIGIIEVSKNFTPYVSYESKTVKKEVGWFNKRTIYHRKFRIYGVSNFKSQCMNAGEETVMATARVIAEKLNIDLIKVINENIRNQLDNDIEIINNIINEKRNEVNEIIMSIKKVNKLIDDLEECRNIKVLGSKNEAELEAAISNDKCTRVHSQENLRDINNNIEGSIHQKSKNKIVNFIFKLLSLVSYIWIVFWTICCLLSGIPQMDDIIVLIVLNIIPCIFLIFRFIAKKIKKIK
ncbi:dynamin family protein [Clostridium nigeriense]|uniref:dynamin family protein n=1 Tax=Clostridium nigeriense TaxID=1805470 RepID=UPI003D3497FA